MPTFQAYKCTNTTWINTKSKSFLKIPEPKNPTEEKKSVAMPTQYGYRREHKNI